MTGTSWVWAKPCKFQPKLIVNENCGEECDKCGWNPEVEEKRKAEIRKLAREGRVTEWGKPLAVFPSSAPSPRNAHVPQAGPSRTEWHLPPEGTAEMEG